MNMFLPVCYRMNAGFVHDLVCYLTSTTVELSLTLSSLPPIAILCLSSGYCSFMFPCLHYALAPGDSTSLCTIFLLNNSYTLHASCIDSLTNSPFSLVIHTSLPFLTSTEPRVSRSMSYSNQNRSFNCEHSVDFHTYRTHLC